MATIIVCIIVFGAIGLDVWYLIRRKKQGKGTCSCDSGGSCSGNCGSCSGCH